MATIELRRVYEPAADADGYRILVDRLWPRGLAHDRAELDDWLKDIAPSPGLRTWWHHDPARLTAFADRYRAELDHNPAVTQLRNLLDEHHRVCLLYAARDPSVNHAQILREYLLSDRADSRTDQGRR